MAVLIGDTEVSGTIEFNIESKIIRNEVWWGFEIVEITHKRVRRKVKIMFFPPLSHDEFEGLEKGLMRETTVTTVIKGRKIKVTEICFRSKGYKGMHPELPPHNYIEGAYGKLTFTEE